MSKNYAAPIAWLLLNIVAFTWLPAGVRADEPLVRQLPDGWKVERSFDASPQQLAALAPKLGGQVKSLSNSDVARGTQRAKLNVIRCGSAADALAVYASLAKVKSDKRFLIRRDATTVIEIVTSDLIFGLETRHLPGVMPAKVKYQVEFDAAPITGGDYMTWNRVYQLADAADRAAPDKRDEWTKPLAKLAGQFTFGNSLSLRTVGQGSVPTVWKFTPAPTATKLLPNGQTHFTFDKLPKFAEFPVVETSAIIISEASGQTPDADVDRAGYLAETKTWPTKDKLVAQLAAEITAKCKTDREKVEALLGWTRRTLKFGGDVTGSRYGTSKVLETKLGHCWDFSDVFVTLARAAGLPCRQVGGWVPNLNQGHVWAEVLLGDHWLAVDPTTGLRCSSDYVPILISSDGQWPLLYLSEVKISELTGE